MLSKVNPRLDLTRCPVDIVSSASSSGGASSCLRSALLSSAIGRAASGGGGASSAAAAGGGATGGSLLDIDPVILIQLLDLKEHNNTESLWGLQPRHAASLLHGQASLPSRKEREHRPQVVRRSPPDSAVLVRLKAQMAEVRSKMSDVKSQVLEARAASDMRPGPSGIFG
ncbi:E3 ubiquitin-protein ligase TRIM37-like, partial [Hippocampus comes]|uniref:E3 ubiquitin-protein ligase TRIM37-like n=1 Tax=Hippocampus comes TaxID=109280 RepID=UPI00094EE126